MKNKMQEIIDLISEFLQNKITAKELEEQISKFFLGNQKLLKQELGKDGYDILKEFDEDFDFFEPHPEIRKENKYYFDEEELRRRAKTTYNKIKRSLAKKGRMNKNKVNKRGTNITFTQLGLFSLVGALVKSMGNEK